MIDRVTDRETDKESDRSGGGPQKGESTGVTRGTLRGQRGILEGGKGTGEREGAPWSADVVRASTERITRSFCVCKRSMN